MKTISLALLLLVPAWSWAACTDGVDCYCDTVTDPNLLLCEDFDAPSMHPADATERDSYDGDGAPGYGSWDDATGCGNRGCNSYWSRVYGASGFGCYSDNAFDIGEWRFDNLFGTNSIACVDILADGEFDDEVAGITAPTAIHDGNWSFGHRIRTGVEHTIGQEEGFAAVTTLGITMAVAYPSNSGSSNIWSAPWKHNEMKYNGFGDGTDFNPFLFWFDGVGDFVRPFNPGVKSDNANLSTCQAAVAGATETVGSFRCSFDGKRLYLDVANYNQATDWPWGEWRCVRGYLNNWNTGSTTWQIWLGDTAIFDGIIDTTWVDANSWDGYKWNAFANANQGLGEGSPTTDTTYRYEDNVHITEGTPVTCEAIGFGAAPDSQPDFEGITITLQESVEDENGLPFGSNKTRLASSTVFRSHGGNLSFPASSELGGGSHQFDILQDISQTCGLTVSALATSTSVDGLESASSNVVDHTLPPCVEDCSQDGDLDNDGLAGCDDPDCSTELRCMSLAPGAPTLTIQ